MSMDIVWTHHAEERLRRWQEQRGITREEVERTVRNPEQIVPGRRDAQVAQSHRGPGLLRVPFVQDGQERILLTLYWTSKVNKYWRADDHEDNL